MDQKCQYLAKKANFGPNLAVHEHKILIFLGVSKSFGTHIKENHLGNLFFGQALDQMGQKGRYLAKNASYEQNLQEIAPRLHGLHAHKMDCKTRQSEAMEE